METQFWLDRWQSNEIGFHLQQVHPLLRRHIAALHLNAESQILVPLCGKSLDLAFLSHYAKRVVGVELAERAVQAFFREQVMQPGSAVLDATHRDYHAGNIHIWQGDFFTLHTSVRFDAIYDRAALIALPPRMREAYVAKLAGLCKPGGHLLLIGLTHGNPGEGPPFSLIDADIHRLLDPWFAIEKHGDYASEVKGKPATEVVWHGTRHAHAVNR